LARETEVLGENLPQGHFCPSQNLTWPNPDLNPGRLGGKPATNRLSYGVAESLCTVCLFFFFFASSRKVTGSSPDEVDFLNWRNPSGRTGPGVDSASNRNEYQESLKI
jgi:hypothetical protein